MRPLLVLVSLLALVACATPQQACIAQATRDARVLDALILQTRGNLARGFAVEEVQEVRTVRDTCTGRNEDGSTFRFRCERTQTVTVEQAVAIDLDAERAKLASLEQRQLQNRANAEAAVQQCRAAYPE